jgi:hypothetical protein
MGGDTVNVIELVHLTTLADETTVIGVSLGLAALLVTMLAFLVRIVWMLSTMAAAIKESSDVIKEHKAIITRHETEIHAVKQSVGILEDRDERTPMPFNPSRR